MVVFVLIEVHHYPDVDGKDEIRGIYDSREKAEMALEEIRPGVEHYLGGDVCDVSSTYELMIEEFIVE